MVRIQWTDLPYVPYSPTAASLSRHQQVHAKLQLEIMEVKDEVVRLKGELRRDQDPGKMSRIQTQIGVSCPSPKPMACAWRHS